MLPTFGAFNCLQIIQLRYVITFGAFNCIQRIQLRYVTYIWCIHFLQRIQLRYVTRFGAFNCLQRIHLKYVTYIWCISLFIENTAEICYLHLVYFIFYREYSRDMFPIFGVFYFLQRIQQRYVSYIWCISLFIDNTAQICYLHLVHFTFYREYSRDMSPIFGVFYFLQRIQLRYVTYIWFISLFIENTAEISTYIWCI